MRQDELQMRIAAWLLFTVSLTAAAVETQRYYVTHLGTFRATIGDAHTAGGAAHSMRSSTVDTRRAIRDAQAGAPAPLPSARRAEVDHRALTRGDAMLLVLLMAGGSRPIIR